MSQKGEQGHCTVLPAAEGDSGREKGSRTLQERPSLLVHLQAAFIFFLLALSSPAHSFIGGVLHPTLIALKLSNNGLAEFLILCPKRCNINFHLIQMQPAPRGCKP